MPVILQLIFNVSVTEQKDHFSLKFKFRRKLHDHIYTYLVDKPMNMIYDNCSKSFSFSEFQDLHHFTLVPTNFSLAFFKHLWAGNRKNHVDLQNA
jgi:hypothetical protein